MFFAGCCAYRITTCCYLAISARDGVILARRHFTDMSVIYEKEMVKVGVASNVTLPKLIDVCTYVTHSV